MSITQDWTGASGANYTYHIHQLPWPPGPGQKGNYIFAKQIGGLWNAVYIGEGELIDRYNAALREGCVVDNIATHYHEHLNVSEVARKNQEKDLIAGNPECKSPAGCNGHNT